MRCGAVGPAQVVLLDTVPYTQAVVSIMFLGLGAMCQAEALPYRDRKLHNLHNFNLMCPLGLGWVDRNFKQFGAI